MEERLVRFRPRAILVVLGIILAGIVLIEVVQAAQGILIWIFVAIFLALALNPAVESLQRRGVARRGLAVGIVFIGAILVIVAIAATIIPTLVSQVNDFVDAVPGYVEDLTAGRGKLGFLERDYQITERVREALGEGGASKLLGFSGTALAVTKGVVTAVIATVTIAFLTFFMLLEGPAWVERFYSLLPAEQQPRWRKIGARDLRHDRRLRDRQPRDQPDRRRRLDGRPARAGRALRGRARASRRDPRPDPARRRDDRRHPRHDRRLPRLDDLRRDRADLLHPLPAAREPRPAADRLRAYRQALAAGGPDRRPDRRRAGRRRRRARRDPGRRHDPGDPGRLARAQACEARVCRPSRQPSSPRVPPSIG